MKVLFCCVAILAAANLAASVTSSEELLELKVNMVKSYLKERQAMTMLREKTEQVCPGYGNKIESAIMKVQTCTNDIDENTETMCSAVKNHFERCGSPVVNLFEECLPEKAKDLPSLITKSILAVTEQICRTDGEHIFELSNPCVRSHNYRTQRCIRKIQTKIQQYSSKYPSKEEVCDFMSSFKGCLQSHLHASCGHETTREAFLNLYEAAQSPCQAESLNEIEILEPKLY